ncbi:MAG: hypothetical protein K2J80_06080 [Oscillospiraceae bacterium]|nr:hypothetical protein [Oscillospiraceae bacterium]
MASKKMYIIITHTPSVVSKIIRKFTHTPYNHVSVSLDAELDHMFSFGRRYRYFPWIGGFVQESPNFGTLERFPETEAIVLMLDVDETAYDDISERLEDMLAHKYSYCYDVLGLLLAIFGKTYKRDKRYYCSAFVRELLVEFGIENGSSFEKIVTPMDFLNLPNTREIYRGKLREFPEQAERIRLG